MAPLYLSQAQPEELWQYPWDSFPYTSCLDKTGLQWLCYKQEGVELVLATIRGPRTQLCGSHHPEPCNFPQCVPEDHLQASGCISQTLVGCVRDSHPPSLHHKVAKSTLTHVWCVFPILSMIGGDRGFRICLLCFKSLLFP